ncbi:MAG: CaiB/BaiF CoA-transferase family protein [Desulfobacteraceae bacterium]|jgi:crotonobetainyl-CoA:carnitine CoA-transferase CaiB-like acyl-CoA transferase|nr:CaiB/BaiF CoA-transferase family protein [Desulfobacteraceae bacterium]
MTNNGALSGLTVLDLSRLLPGPFCSMILADHGARVIAIEDKRYAAEAGINSAVLRNKEHITLNLKSDKGREIFFKMAEKADIVLDGFRPGVTKRLGVDYESVKKINPGIIYCSISGYGQTGPYRDEAGHDVNYLSVAGVLDLIGEKDRPPSIPGIQIADIAGGGMYAAIGILMALHARQKSGTGQYIDISMTDGSMSFLSLVLSLKKYAGMPVKRSDSFLSHRYACYNTYETADNRYLSIGAVENRFWKNLCNYFNKPDYIALQYDDGKKDEIIQFVREKFKQKPLSYWCEELDGQDICWGPVRSLDEAMEDPLFKAREMVVDLQSSTGEILKCIGVPVKLSETPGSVRQLPPSFGENTASVLNEFGYSADNIKELEAQGII